MTYAKCAPPVVADLCLALAAPRVDYHRVGSLITQAHVLLRDRMRCSTR